METADYKGGVVFRTEYVVSSDKHFKGYIDYINRSEAQRNDAYNLYSAYVTDYMDNPLKQRLGDRPERTSALFTESRDTLSVAEKNELKNKFEEAQENQSLMWQPIFSFKNEFLAEYGFLDEKTGFLDETRLRDATRIAMQELLKSEGMEESAVWAGSIHYNTKHLHIHIAIVEPNPTREIITTKDGKKERKGKFKINTIENTKSKFLNTLVDRSESYKKINSIIRDNLVAGLKEKDLYKNEKFLELYRSLPDDKRKWNYNMNALKTIRPKIDSITEDYLNTYNEEAYKILCAELDKEVAFQNKAYGRNNDKYKKTKLNDMYTRMGNIILKQAKEYDRLIKGKRYIKRSNLSQKQKLKEYSKLIKSYKSQKLSTQIERCLDSMIWYLTLAARSEMSNNKNQRKYQQLMEDIEQE